MSEPPSRKVAPQRFSMHSPPTIPIVSEKRIRRESAPPSFMAMPSMTKVLRAEQTLPDPLTHSAMEALSADRRHQQQQLQLLAISQSKSDNTHYKRERSSTKERDRESNAADGQTSRERMIASTVKPLPALPARKHGAKESFQARTLKQKSTRSRHHKSVSPLKKKGSRSTNSSSSRVHPKRSSSLAAAPHFTNKTSRAFHHHTLSAPPLDAISPSQPYYRERPGHHPNPLRQHPVHHPDPLRQHPPIHHRTASVPRRNENMSESSSPILVSVDDFDIEAQRPFGHHTDALRYDRQSGGGVLSKDDRRRHLHETNNAQQYNDHVPSSTGHSKPGNKTGNGGGGAKSGWWVVRTLGNLVDKVIEKVADAWSDKDVGSDVERGLLVPVAEDKRMGIGREEAARRYVRFIESVEKRG